MIFQFVTLTALLLSATATGAAPMLRKNNNNNNSGGAISKTGRELETDATLTALLLSAATTAKAAPMLRKNNNNSGAAISTAGRELQTDPPTIIDFASYATGDVVSDLGSGVTVYAVRRNSDGSLEPGRAVVFNTANPPRADRDLGTPHKSFGGPGRGKAGKKNKLFQNANPKGLALIIDTVAAAGNVTNNPPNDNQYGGYLIFQFDPPRYLSSMGFLDNDSGFSVQTTTADNGRDTRFNENGGNNSFEDVAIGKPAVKRLKVHLFGSGAITDLNFVSPTTVCGAEGAPVSLGLEPFGAGETVTNLGNGVVVGAFKRNGNGTVEFAEAMIFDSGNPTGGDKDLGTPHKTFGGPGIGKAGKKGQLFENKDFLGNVIIISQDGNPLDPNDNEGEGVLIFQFDPPRAIETLGLLDNDEGTVVEVITRDFGQSKIINKNGSNNSVENLAIGKPSVSMILVAFAGSGAVSDIISCE